MSLDSSSLYEKRPARKQCTTADKNKYLTSHVEGSYNIWYHRFENHSDHDRQIRYEFTLFISN